MTDINERAYELQNKYPAGISDKQLQCEIPDYTERIEIYNRIVWLYADKSGAIFGD